MFGGGGWSSQRGRGGLSSRGISLPGFLLSFWMIVISTFQLNQLPFLNCLWVHRSMHIAVPAHLFVTSCHALARLVWMNILVFVVLLIFIVPLVAICLIFTIDFIFVCFISLSLNSTGWAQIWAESIYSPFSEDPECVAGSCCTWYAHSSPPPHLHLHLCPCLSLSKLHKGISSKSNTKQFLTFLLASFTRARSATHLFFKTCAIKSHTAQPPSHCMRIADPAWAYAYECWWSVPICAQNGPFYLLNDLFNK